MGKKEKRKLGKKNQNKRTEKSVTLMNFKLFFLAKDEFSHLITSPEVF